ncbi:MAG: YceD family protein [Nitrospiraceae bacterium]
MPHGFDGRVSGAELEGTALNDDMVAIMDALSPRVGDVPEEGLNISCDATAEDVGLRETDARLHGPLAVNLDLAKKCRSITVNGAVEALVLRQCVRCLKEYQDPLAVVLSTDYVRQEGTPPPRSKPTSVSKRQKQEPNAPPAEDDVNDEMYSYQGDQLDLAPMLREQVILAAPMQPLCQEDCQGLCPRCGQDFNESRCVCAEEPLSNPFHVLRGLKARSDGDTRV